LDLLTHCVRKTLYVPDANSQAAAAAMRRIKPPLLITDFGELELINFTRDDRQAELVKTENLKFQ